jgi:hypothetical protein
MTKPKPYIFFFWLFTILTIHPTIKAQEITDNNFNLDAVNGPVLGASRIVGLGGAYTALAEGINGASWNPASFASRTPYEIDWYEWDLAFSIFSPSVFNQDDFFNNKVGLTVDKFIFINLGLRFQFGVWGIGLDLRSETFDIDTPTGTTSITLLEGHLGSAYGYWNGQLIVGLGVRFADLDIGLKNQDSLVHFTGTGLESGILLRLTDQPWRLGFAGRLPVESLVKTSNGVETTDGVSSVRGFILPNKVYMPWEVQIGFAWQFGSRQLNREAKKSSDDIIEQEQPRDRDYWLVSTELLIIGPTQKGVGIDGFLEQQDRRAGKYASLGTRLGFECEPLTNRLKLRGGFYIEPSRTQQGSYRPHATGGFDVRLFSWDLFGLFSPFDLQLSLTGDFGPRYVDIGLGIGFWH